jgi:hypothetical protein
MSTCSASSNIRSQLFAPIVYLEASGTRIAFTIDTANTGYTIGSGITGGSVIRYNPDTLSYVTSNAKEASTAEVIGVVESMNYSSGATVFTVVSNGLINYPGLASVPDLYTPGSGCSPETTLSGGEGGKDVLFLSDGCSGSVQFIEPVTPGAIVKPVMQVLKTSSYNAIVLNYIGYEIGESAQAEFPIDGFVGQIVYIPEPNAVAPYGYLRIDTEKLVNFSEYLDLHNLFGTNYGYYTEEIQISQPVTSDFLGLLFNQPESSSSGLIESIIVGPPGVGKIVIKKTFSSPYTLIASNVNLTSFTSSLSYNITPTSVTTKQFTVPSVPTTTQTFISSTTPPRTVNLIPFIKAKNNLSYVSLVDNLKLQGLCLGSINSVEATIDYLCSQPGINCP